MRLVQAKVARAPQSHRAYSLRMHPFNACPVAIGIFECIRLLSLASCKQRLHLLSWLQRHGAPRRSSTGCPTRAGFTIRLGKLHLNERLAFGILDRRPARTDPTLWTGDRLRLP